ncbi:hypothetical protein PALA111701_09770 [Paenibacillus lactis]
MSRGYCMSGQASRKNRLYPFSPIRGGCRSCTMTSRKGRMNVRALKEPWKGVTLLNTHFIHNRIQERGLEI